MVSYSPDTQNRTVTNALGVQDTYIVTTLQNVPKVTQINRAATANTPPMTRSFTYDNNGYLASRTDWNGNLTNYANNLHGEPTTINEAVGTPVRRTTTIVYDTQFVHLPDSIATSGLTTSYTYDGSGNPLIKILTDTTNMRRHRPANGQMRTWTYTWSNFLPTSIKTPNGNSTAFTYDSTGALTAITNPLNQTTSITGHTPGGYPQTIVDPNGVTTTLAYDSEMRVTSSAINTSLGLLTTQHNYWFEDKVSSTVLPDGSVWSSAFDDALRLIENADIYQNNIQYTLDPLGDRTQINTYDGGSNLHRQHSATYDDLGRMLTDVGGVNQTTTYTYDNNGNALTVTDPLHHTTTQLFDALNRLSQSTDANNGVTHITYDAHDRPLTVTDPNGGQTAYIYDGFGDVIQQVSPDSGTTLYSYDLDGNLVQRVAATGAVTQYTYDPLDRVSATSYPADPTENVAYTYDQSGHGFGIGRLTSVSDAAGSLSRSYDERGNVTHEARSHGTLRLNTAYSYDRASRIARITYPSNWQASYVRDNAGRVTSVSARLLTASAVPPVGLLPVVSNITYQPFGPVTGSTFGNGVADSRSYDLDYRLLNLADSGTATVQNLTYGYDLADNVNAIADAVSPNNNQSFGYDVLNRLSSASGGYGAYSWTYNGVGGRLSETLGTGTTGYAYGAHNNQLLTLSQNGIPIQNIGYTADGNTNSFNPGIMSPGGQLITRLSYNQNAQLAAVLSGSEALAQYTYDAFGQRLVKTLSGSTAALYQNDLRGRLLEETNGQGVPQADYIYLNGTPIATISPGAKAVYFLHDERLGTPQLATDSGQNTAWSATYLPFGGTSSVQGMITQNLRLPGQHFDSESGWNHNGFRNYAQNWGRYLEKDPIGLKGGLNSYRYSESNPMKFTDSVGLDDVNEDLIDQAYGSDHCCPVRSRRESVG
jgi:RHS repeat-associated protein